VTSRRFRTARGRSRHSAARTPRSAQSNRGFGFARRRTETSRRSTSRSASFDAVDRASNADKPAGRRSGRIDATTRNAIMPEQPVCRLSPTSGTPTGCSAAVSSTRPLHASHDRATNPVSVVAEPASPRSDDSVSIRTATRSGDQVMPTVYKPSGSGPPRSAAPTEI